MIRCIKIGICALAMLLGAACGDVHDNEYPLATGEGAVIVGLQAEAQGVEVGNLVLCLFDENGNCLRKDYDAPRLLAAEYLPVEAGAYTLLVVANVPAEALPEEVTLPDLAGWLEEHVGEYPGMLTASAQAGIEAGDVHRLLLELKGGTEGICLSAVRLVLSLPDGAMPDYASARVAGSRQLRCVAEVYRQGTADRVHRRTLLCPLQDDGTCLAGLWLLPGDYDLCLWADWTDGVTAESKYYDAGDLHQVTVLTDGYVANGETDKKAAYYCASALNVGGEPQEVNLGMASPFAKYRLVATDVEAYLNLIENGEALPPIGDLEVRVTYEGFFPTGFNVASGKPNDALNVGIHYASMPVAAEGYAETEARQVGADFVLANGGESFVTVTVEMTDSRTGEVVASVPGVKISYKRGHLTTVTGHFLTAGKTTGGVEVDAGWGEEITVPF